MQKKFHEYGVEIGKLQRKAGKDCDVIDNLPSQ
jgi:hypothetical protein